MTNGVLPRETWTGSCGRSCRPVKKARHIGLLVLEEDSVFKGEGRQGAGALSELVIYTPVVLG